MRRRVKGEGIVGLVPMKLAERERGKGCISQFF